MAIQNIWRMHSVTLNGPAVIVGSMNSVAMPTDAEVIREVNSSRIFPFQSHLNFRSASINFTSWNLADLLGAVDLEGECIGTGETVTSVDVNVAKFDCNSIEDMTTYTINKGIIFPTSITVDHQGNAQVSYTIIAIGDGANDPIVKLDAQAIPTIPAGEDDRWTMFKNFVGGVEMFQVKSINVDFGAQTSTEGADSEQFDSWVSLDQVLPVVTYTGITPDFLKLAVPAPEEITTLGGEAVTGGLDDTRITLKERNSVIAATAHILIDIWGLARVTDPFSSTGNDAGRSEIRIEANQGPLAANLPLTIQVDAIIPGP